MLRQVSPGSQYKRKPQVLFLSSNRTICSFCRSHHYKTAKLCMSSKMVQLKLFNPFSKKKKPFKTYIVALCYTMDDP